MKSIVLNKLNLSQYSGFVYNSTVLSHCAVGVTTNTNDENIKVTLDSLGFENPAGGMLASANDMAKLMQFMFRNNISTSDDDNPHQLLDGNTVDEMLTPIITMHDDYQTIGNPWEMQFITFNNTVGNAYDYNNDDYRSLELSLSQASQIGVWTKSKQGSLPGYRTSTSMVPDYKLGVFTGALIQDVNDTFVWSYDVLKIILPTLNDILTKQTNIKFYKHQLPSNYKDLIGVYSFNSSFPSVEIFVKNDSYLMVNAYQWLGSFLRLEMFYDENGNVLQNILRGRKDVNDTNLKQGCRTLEDGPDYELFYFNFDSSSLNQPSDSHATSFIFMATQYAYVNQTL